MTEKEVIERCKKITTEKFNLDYSIDNIDKEAIETVLNLLEKKDTLIHTMQSEFERLEDLEDNTDMLKMELEKKDIDIIEAKEANRQLSIELQKKDKIINLMEDEINKLLKDGFERIGLDVYLEKENITVREFIERKVEREEK